MQAEQVVGRVYERYSGGKLHDQILLVIWFLVISLPIAGLTPFRYIFILYFLSFFLFDTRNIVSGVVSAWWLIPFLCVAFLSYFWSPYGGQALRAALFQILSTTLIIVVAARFTPQQIVRCLLLTCSVVLGYFIVQPIPIEQGAGFGSKNYAALFMLSGFIVSFATALDIKEFEPLRLLGLVLSPIFAFFIVSANSTTALFMLVISATLLLGMRLLLLDARRIRGLISGLIVVSLVLGVAALYAALIFVDQEVIDSFLGAFGKDSSFTGRTALWDEATNQIETRPYLGVGLEGFWQYDVGSAQTLNENDHKPFGTRLTFHNAHLEVMVHLGLIGYGCFLLSILTVIWFTLKRLVAHCDMAVITFCVVIVIGLISSFVESSLWSAFNLQAFMFFVGGVAYARGERRRYVGNVVVSDADAAASVSA